MPRRILALLASWLLAWCGLAAAQAVTTLTEASLWLAPRMSDAQAATRADLPPPDAVWQVVRLPYTLKEPRTDELVQAWVRVRWDLAQPLPQSPALYLSRLSIGGEFFVNGTRIASMRHTDVQTQMRWRRPHLLVVPPSLLHAGTNELLVRVTTRDANTTIPEIGVGPEAALRPAYDRRYLAEYSSAQFSTVAAAIVSLFMLGIWWFRRGERLYLLFGLTCLFWALRTQTYLTEAVPWTWWWPWRALYAAWTGCFSLSVAAFFLSYIGRLRWRWRMGLLCYALAGPLLLVLSQGRMEQVVAIYWTGGLFALEFYVLWSFTTWLKHHPSLEAFSLAGAALLVFLLAANDYAVRSGWMPYSNAYAMHFGAPVVMLAMGGLLATRFVQAMRQIEVANQELKHKLAEQEVQLSRQHDVLRQAERSQALAAERQRIMQDMHDGLGSQLLTSLAVVERGAMDSRSMAQALRDSIDDMRLAIDTLSPDHGGLLEAIGNLRYRLEPRFRAAGIALRFVFREVPDHLALPTSTSLQILRMLQEALTNVIKHAAATHVEVEIAVAVASGQLALCVSDNGKGFILDQAGSGRGLVGMRKRAQRIGAEFVLHSGTAGTRVQWTCPISGR